MSDGFCVCASAVGDMVDSDEAGDERKALDDQRHGIVEEPCHGQTENAALDEEEQEKRPDDHEPGEYENRRRHGEPAAHTEVEHDAADDPAWQ